MTFPRPPRTIELAQARNDDFVLPFILAGATGRAPSWGGILALDDPALLAVSAPARRSLPRIEQHWAQFTRTPSMSTSRATYVSLVTEALAELHRERETAITLTLEVKGDSRLTPLACDVLHAAAERELDVTVDVMVRNCDLEGAWRTLSS